jgi:N-acetylmuramoyl-L-alanine amidase
MSRLRRAATACLVILPMLLLGAGRHPARSAGQAPLAKPATCQRSAFRTVVDVGHTVGVPGAISARGVPEYAFNLQLADAAKQVLVAADFDKTIRLVTATAPPMGLIERAALANKMRADLFISIHHDSVPDYLLETWQYEGQQRQFSDRFQGYAIFISHDNADRAGSLQFGGFLGKALQARGLQYTPHYTLPLMGNHRRELIDAAAGVYRYDQLIVLRNARMPAVLLEAGSIVNRQEELELASRERRELISAAVVAAVEDFCTVRSRRGRYAPSKRSPHPHAMVRPGHAHSALSPSHPLPLPEPAFA